MYNCALAYIITCVLYYRASIHVYIAFVNLIHYFKMLICNQRLKFISNNRRNVNYHLNLKRLKNALDDITKLNEKQQNFEFKTCEAWGRALNMKQLMKKHNGRPFS